MGYTISPFLQIGFVTFICHIRLYAKMTTICAFALQVQLTADYAPKKLMEFLAASQYYPLEGALSICQRKGLIAEQVCVGVCV